MSNIFNLEIGFLALWRVCTGGRLLASTSHPIYNQTLPTVILCIKVVICCLQYHIHNNSKHTCSQTKHESCKIKITKIRCWITCGLFRPFLSMYLHVCRCCFSNTLFFLSNLLSLAHHCFQGFYRIFGPILGEQLVNAEVHSTHIRRSLYPDTTPL